MCCVVVCCSVSSVDVDCMSNAHVASVGMESVSALRYLHWLQEYGLSLDNILMLLRKL